MEKHEHRAVKAGAWYTASSFLIRSIGLITTPVFTRLLTKAEFGLFNNFTSWLSIITIIVTLNLESTLISARYDYEDDFDGYIFSMLALSTLSGVIWITVMNCFRDFFTDLFHLQPVYMNAMLVYLLFLPAVSLFQARERYLFEYKKTVAASLFIAIGTSLLSVLLVVLLPDRLFGRISGFVLPTIVLGFVFYIYFVVKGKRIRIRYWKYALPICLPFIPHLLSLNVLNSMDKTMITRYCGAESNAIYSIAYTCGSMVTLLLTSMNSAFAPWLGEKLNVNDYASIRKVSGIYILCFCFLSVGMMALAPEALMVIGGKAYADAKYVMTPIAMGCVCQFLYTLFVNVEQFRKKTGGMAVASVLAAGVNYLLNEMLIPRYGYLAAAYTTLIGYLCLLGMHMFLVYRLGMKVVYNYKMIALTIAVMLGAMLLMNQLYHHSILRYLFILIYGILLVSLLVRHKSAIKQLIKGRSA